MLEHRLLDALALEILGNPGDYRHIYKAQAVHDAFVALRGRPAPAQPGPSRPVSVAPPATSVTTRLSGAALLARVAEIKEEVIRSGHVNNVRRDDFNNYFDGVEPEIIASIGVVGFINRLRAFLEMKALMAQGTVYDASLSSAEVAAIKAASPFHVDPTTLYTADFHLLVNHNLLSDQEAANILRIGIQAAVGIYDRLCSQTTRRGATEAGLTNWGNTCWVNTAIQTMINRVTTGQLASLRAQTTPEMAELRAAFVALINRGQAILGGQEDPAVITKEQSRFMLALLACGRTRQLGSMSDWFNHNNIQDIHQQDSGEFLTSICQLLGVYDDGSQGTDVTTLHRATFNNQEYHRTTHDSQSIDSLVSFAPTNMDPGSVLMSDWFDGILAGMPGPTMTMPWSSADLGGASAQTQQLDTTQVRMLRVNPAVFQQTVLSLGTNEQTRLLARQALINSALVEENLLRVPIFDVTDNRTRTMVLRLCGVGLHRGTQQQGHYMHMTLGDNGKCIIQDDSVSAPLAVYQQHLPSDDGHVAADWHELLTIRGLTPAYCEYELLYLEEGVPNR